MLAVPAALAAPGAPHRFPVPHAVHPFHERLHAGHHPQARALVHPVWDPDLHAVNPPRLLILR